MQDIILDTLLDSIRLVPFLFLTYAAMEYLEHRAGGKAQAFVKKSGRFGPVIGGILGVVPQCGFSAAASGLYAGRVITLGTLMAIFLSTSDEMLPILISEAVALPVILKILGMKMLIGILAGLIIDLFIRQKTEENHSHIHEMCEHDHCHCKEGSGILKSAVSHTLQITFFLMVISFALNTALHYIGEEALGSLILNKPVLGPLLAGLVGLIPNCAASVVITQLYLQGVMSLGAMMAGLLVGAGIGILVLLRSNTDRRESLKIIGLLYVTGVLSGILTELLHITV